MSDKARIAIIGAGNHARRQHYPPLRHIDKIDFCAACDLNEERLAKVAEIYGIPAVYTDFRRMIEKERPDGVVIVMTPMDMKKIVFDCIDMGQNIMIEKPPGCNTAEARAFLEAARKNNVKVMVSVNRRFVPLIRKVRETAREKGIVYCSGVYNKQGFFKGSWTWPSSLPVADAIHVIDTICYICGKPVEVHSIANSRNSDYVNSCSAHVLFESGATATLNTHHCVGFRVQQVDVHAMGFSAYMDVASTGTPEYKAWMDNDPVEYDLPELDLPEDVTDDSYHESLHFAEWLKDEVEPVSALEDVIDSVLLAEACSDGFKGKLDSYV